jgi:hypothetical protein
MNDKSIPEPYLYLTESKGNQYHFLATNIQIKMNQKKYLLLGLLLTLCLINITQSKLVYLLEIARHGAKYPSKNITTTVDPPNLAGQLTGVGIRQHYLLGSYLYKDYILNQELISGKLNPRQVEIISSSYQRSIDSAFSQANGLFPNY